MKDILETKKIILKVGDNDDDLRDYFIISIRKLLRRFTNESDENTRIREAIVAFLRDVHSFKWKDISWMFDKREDSVIARYNSYHNRKLVNPKAYLAFENEVHHLYYQINRILRGN